MRTAASATAGDHPLGRALGGAARSAYHVGMRSARSRLWYLALVALPLVDLALAHWLGVTDSRAPLWRQRFVNFTYQLGKGSSVVAVAAGLALAGWWADRARWRLGGRWLVGTVLLGGFWCQVLKHLVGRPRPNGFLDHGWVLPCGPTCAASWDSLPSGHTVTMFAAVPLLEAILPRAGSLWRILAWAVAAGRVLGTAHYLSDVLLAAALGWRLGVYARDRWAAEVLDEAE